MRVFLRYGWILIAMMVAGCGTYATPVWQAEASTTENVALISDAQSVSEPTIAPTETPIPPTPTLEPTSTPTDEPAPTEEPTEETVGSPIDRLVAIRDPENGKGLFETFQSSTGFACSTCHNADSEVQLIGPGLLNVNARAETRVEGQSAAEYIYNSIIDPSAYVVEGFPDDVMPKTWEDVYSSTELLILLHIL